MQAHGPAAPGEPPERDWTRVIVVLLVWCALGFGTAVAVYATDASAGVGALLVAFAVLIGAARLVRRRAGADGTGKGQQTPHPGAQERARRSSRWPRPRPSGGCRWRSSSATRTPASTSSGSGASRCLLAEAIGMDAEFCERIRHAAPLHDVGKVAIPDHILLKPGPLTPEERAIVETHAEEGSPARAWVLVGDPRHGGHDRAEPPGEVGRQRLPAGPEGRSDPDRGPDRGRGGRVRRPHQRPRVPPRLPRRRGESR